MKNKFKHSSKNICVVGLGYVGLPLAVEFGKHQPVIGFDVSSSRVGQLLNGVDVTLEISSENLAAAKNLTFSCNLADIVGCDTYIITVPTPVYQSNTPDLSLLITATEMIGSILSPGNTVIYESTVYPGATEEVCIPLLEQQSNLKINSEFYVGYSPERINPGDKLRKLPDVVKVTSGSNKETSVFVSTLYNKIIRAGTYNANSIKTAEAAKVIENVQRDVNIALVNELAMVFDRLGLDTLEVLNAASTKWNFIPFRPGLVGGHCIGVDPYYLIYKSQMMGHHAEVISAGRRINDNMSAFVASKLIKALLKRDQLSKHPRILILGFTFKENCPDIRNTKIWDLIVEIQDFGGEVDVVDPWVEPSEALKSYNLLVSKGVSEKNYDAVILAVAHKEFIDMGAKSLRAFCKPNGILFDIKSCLPAGESDLRL